MIARLQLRENLHRMDWVMFSTILVLIVGGVFCIFSATYEGHEARQAMHIKQIAWVILGLGAFFFVSSLDYRWLAEYSVWYLLASLVLLLLVFVIGTEINNAHRWIKLGPFLLQPSEVAKFACLLTLAFWLSRPALEINTLHCIGVAGLIAFLPFVLTFIQPDLGTSLAFPLMTVAMLFVAGLRWRILTLFAAAGTGIAVFAWEFLLKPYQKNRLTSFLDPERDPQGAGWNLLQSKIAVGSGGFGGKGFLNGDQKNLDFLPETVAPTDFIFSVIGEEFGFVGSLIVIGCFLIIFYRIYRAVVHSRDMLGRLIGIGVLSVLVLHVYVNVGMTVGLAPITGLPLPLISYGGSFMVSTLAALGLVHSVYILRDRR